MILRIFWMAHILLVLFQDILRSQHFLDYISMSHNLENPVRLIIPEKISSKLHSGQKQTFPYLIFCQDFAYSTLGLLFSKVATSSDWQTLVELGYRVYSVDTLDVCSVHQCKWQHWTWHYTFQDVEWKHFQHIHKKLVLSSIQQGCVLPPCHQGLSLWYHMLFFCMNISASVSTILQMQGRWAQLLCMLLQGLYQIHTHIWPLCMLCIFQALSFF